MSKFDIWETINDLKNKGLYDAGNNPNIRTSEMIEKQLIDNTPEIEELSFDCTDEHLSCGKYLIQVADGVLEESDWPIHLIKIDNGFVTEQKQIYGRKTAHEIPYMIGWDEELVRVWRDQDTTGDPIMIEHLITKL